MPKYWGKQIFSLWSFPEVGQKQKTEKKKEERAKVGNNNGQLRIATPPCVAHAKQPGPIFGFTDRVRSRSPGPTLEYSTSFTFAYNAFHQHR